MAMRALFAEESARRPSPEVSREPRLSGRASATRWSELFTRGFVVTCGGIVILATATMIAFLGQTGIRGLSEIGLWPLLSGAKWKPEANSFGGLALLTGTVLSAAGAVLLGAIPAVLASAWLAELSPRSIRSSFRRVMEIAAAVPSVVYGWLALVYLVPLTERLAHGIYGEDAPVGGEGLAASALLLGAMIIPTVMLLALDALARVPAELRDASAALGASELQTAFRVALPGAWRGILIAVFFGLARAAGETMAVQMVIGGARKLPDNLFSPTTTISTQIVMDMQNARPGTLASNALYSMALVLLVVSVMIVLATRLLSRRTAS
jgi:phosphate transport system permease protein